MVFPLVFYKIIVFFYEKGLCLSNTFFTRVIVITGRMQIMNNVKEIYCFWFEAEDGLVQGKIAARGRNDAHRVIKAAFPRDHNADGEFTDPDGNDFAIQW
jgi:hypothetical protein